MTDDDGKAAYVKAQKQRNLAIGGALLVFVVLVFFITMARIATNAGHTVAQRAAIASSQAAQSLSASQ